MSSASDTMKDIKALLYDRIKNPFISTFIFVSLFHYWPILFHVIDDGKSADQKIQIIKRIIKLDESPGILCLIGYTLLTIIGIAVLSLIASLIKEFTDGLIKKARNRFNPDYINSHKYTEAITSLTSQINLLTESNSKKDEQISMIRGLTNLNDSQKRALLKVKNAGPISEDSLSESEKEDYKYMVKLGIVGASTNGFKINNDSLLAFIDTTFIQQHAFETVSSKTFESEATYHSDS